MSENKETLLRTLTSPQQLNVASLVLSAAGITHRIHYIDQNNLEIYVATELTEKAKFELEEYQLENANWPPVETIDTYTPIFRAMSFIIVGLLVYIYSQTGDWTQDGFWFRQGAGNSKAILLGNEYFRLITALILHADLVHLMGNCLLGGFVIHFFLGITGNGIGLLMILLTGATANYINVLAHGPGHNFVGFSTSIFSVIGMLCAIRFSGKTHKTSLQFILPLMSGLALLAFLGSSGPRTDLGGHFFGLLTGLVFGNFVRLKLFEEVRKSFWLQACLGCITAVIVYCSWWFAFAR